MSCYCGELYCPSCSPSAREAFKQRSERRPEILPINEAIALYQQAEAEFSTAVAQTKEAKVREAAAAMKLELARKKLERAAKG